MQRLWLVGWSVGWRVTGLDRREKVSADQQGGQFQQRGGRAVRVQEIKPLCDCWRGSDRGWEGNAKKCPVLPKGPSSKTKGLCFSFKANGHVVPWKLSASLSFLLPLPDLLDFTVSIMRQKGKGLGLRSPLC